MLPVEIMLLSPFGQNEEIKFPDPVCGMCAAAPVQNSCGQINFPKLLRILPDGFELGIGSPIHGINLIKVLWQLRQKRVRHYAGEAWDGQLCRREQPGRSDADGFHSTPVGGLDTCG